MAIPDFQSLMLPLLKLTADKQEHSLSEVIETLGKQFGLTDIERKQLLPSGKQATFDNRVAWAQSYLKKPCCSKAWERDAFGLQRGAATYSHRLPIK